MKITVLVLLLLWVSQFTSARDSGIFKLIENDKGASVYYKGDEKVILTALEMLIEDSRQVCTNPFSRTEEIKNRTIITGIPDRENHLRELAQKYKVDISGLTGRWEAYTIQIVEAEGNTCLFVLGSDPRGTAYGLLELSRKIGVSPWIWWADVVPEKKKEVAFIPEGKIQAPSVQYRGIFLNDEDWGLMPWSTRTYEPTAQKGAIGPKTYSRIFELLLRVRANTIWPAMHECTLPFFLVEGNREAAEKYGIVLSTSHAEPMMRTNTGEWDSKKYGNFNFLTNREQVLSYWQERVSELKDTENIYTIGMRGIHDGRMQGVKSLDEETGVLREVIDEQRQMLSRNNPGKDITSIPQIFVPYKEVLKAYDNGLKLPEDVTLVWCDDNNGYIMRLSNPEEKKRTGGAGVYYHVSYWGKPHDYLWLGSTQPALIYTEMKRAWDHGARRLWILNVGDIKPNEYLTEFFMDMAWDIEAFSGSTLYSHQKAWINCIFRGDATEEIDRIMREYYQLSGERKPEHMGWNRVEDRLRSEIKDTEFSPFYFGDEIQKRIGRYEEIKGLSEEVMKSQIPDELKPAYFQLIHYPVAASCAMNRKMLYAQKARLYAGYDLPVAGEYGRRAMEAYNEIAALDYRYNKDMLKGKWELMMDMKPRDLPVFQEPMLPVLKKKNTSNKKELVIWVENDTVPLIGNRIVLPSFTGTEEESYFITIHPKGNVPVFWQTDKENKSLNIKEIKTPVSYETKLLIRVGSSSETKGEMPLLINGQTYHLVYDTRTSLTKPGIHMESNRMIALNGCDFTNQITPEIIEGLGHSGKTVRLPVAGKITPKAPHLEYKVQTVSSGNAQIKVGTIPKHPVNGGDIRYAVVVDNDKPQVVSSAAGFLSPVWAENTLRNQSLTMTDVFIDKPGEHTIRIYALDEELLVDQVMMEFDPGRKHYVIPTNN